MIMKNNWIITGDGDSYSEFRGLLYLSEEDMSRWQDVVLEKIRSVKSEKLQEYVKRNPYITIAALFYRGWEISQEDYDHFVNVLSTMPVQSFGMLSQSCASWT